MTNLEPKQSSNGHRENDRQQKPPPPPASKIGACRLDEYLHGKANEAKRDPQDIKTIVLHNTATKSEYVSIEATVQTLHRRGLSYHYLIFEDKIIELRDPDTIAFHALGANKDSIGIAFVGGDADSIDNHNWTPSMGQYNTAYELIKNLKAHYPNLKYITGHGDLTDLKPYEKRSIDPNFIVNMLNTYWSLFDREDKFKYLKDPNDPDDKEKVLSNYIKTAKELSEKKTDQKTSKNASSNKPRSTAVTCYSSNTPNLRFNLADK